MKRRQTILPLACCIPLLASCTSTQTVGGLPWSVKPHYSVSDSGLSPLAYYQTGRYFQGQQRYDQALQAYRKALDADGSFYEARNGVGVILSLQGRYPEAIEQFTLALKQAPEAAHIHNNLGYAYYLHGRSAEAVAALEQAVKFDAGNSRAHANLGLALAKAGDAEKAQQALGQAAALQDARGEPGPATGNIGPAAAAGQALALPKDRGVIRPLPEVESSLQVVQLAPSVFELRERAAVPRGTPLVAEARKFRVEVSNGNGVTGMARKVGRFLGGNGFVASRITNQKPFRVELSHIYYRAGYLGEAQRVKANLPDQPVLMQSGTLRADIDVRLVLGRDVADRTAYFEAGAGRIRLAQADAGS